VKAESKTIPFHPGGRWRAVCAAVWSGLLAASCGHFDAFRSSGVGTSTLFRGESPVQVSKLNNGLTVIIHESHANPIVTLDVWVNTGSMNEPPEINGVSHFLEHMMFKGTRNRPVGKVDLEIEGVGGETNAGTSKDFTHYYVTIASDYVTTGLDVLSDVIMNSTLDPQEMERERQVILEEYRRKQDSPFSLAYDLICETAYRSGPYRASVLGTTETISNLTRAQMMDYYQRYYTPDNMALVVVGDIKTETLMPQIEQYFGRYRRAAKPFEQLNMQTRWAGTISRVVEKDLRDTYAVLAFPAPSIERPRDTVIMDVILGILGEGRSSRLYQTLREKKKLVSGVSAGYATPKKPGLFMIFATLEGKNLDAMREATLEEIRRLRTRNVGRRELAKVKKMYTNEFYFANETTNGQSDTLGLYYTLSGSEKYERNYLREIARVTTADVRRVARDYLDPDKVVMITLRPKSGNEKAGGGK
jgi:zinc protease